MVSRRSAALACALLAVFFLLGLFAQDASALWGLGGSGKTFTINSIMADPEKETVTIQFSEPCSQYEGLVHNIKIYPGARVSTYYSGVSGSNTLNLRANVKPGRKYVVHVPKSYTCNGMSYTESLVEFTVPHKVVSVKYLESGTLLELKSRQMIHLSLVNAERLSVTAMGIPPVLAPVVQHGTQYSDMQEMEKALRAEYLKIEPMLKSNSALKVFGGEFPVQSQVFFPGIAQDTEASFSVPMTYRSSRDRGGLVAALFKGEYGSDSSISGLRLYRITDMSVTYKHGSDSLAVWVTSLRSGKPMAGVSLMAIHADSNEAVLLGTTGKDGILAAKAGAALKHFSLAGGGSLKEKPLELKDIAYVIAATETDSSFVMVDSSTFLKPGWVEQSSEGGLRVMKGHIFTERGIYRPGDEVKFKGTVREFFGGEILSPKDKPVTVTAVNSKGETVMTQAFTLSEFGTLSGWLPIKGFYPLGTYTLKMAFGTGEGGTASRTFEVQEFKPPRHFSRIEFEHATRKDTSVAGMDAEIHILNTTISGLYFAGGPVKHGKVRWNIYLSGTNFPQKGFEDYDFGAASKSTEELIESGESILDENGQVLVALPMNSKVLTGLNGIKVTATVVDFDGRAAADTAVYQEKPGYLVGIRRHEEKVKGGSAQVLRALAVDSRGNRITSGTLDVAVKREVEYYTRKRNAIGNVFWDWSKMFKTEFSGTIAIEKGDAVFDFDLLYGGEYIVELSYKAPDGRKYVSSTAYHVEGSYWGYYDTSESQQKFEKLQMTPDKSVYSPGESIRMYLRTDRPLSELLVSVEREGMLKIYTAQFDPAKGYIEIPVERSFMPNVYVSILGTVAREELPVYDKEYDKTAPGFKFGVARVEVRKETSGLTLSINGNEKNMKAGPGEKVTLRLKLTDDAGKPVQGEIAVGVVDESVLRLTGYENPSLDTLASFMAPLGVFTWDGRLDLLSQTPYGYAALKELTGGDGLEESSETPTSKVRKNFDPVAYFNPVVRTGRDGEAEVSFNVPDTMTTYRIYAVACDKGSRFGNIQSGLLVVKDFYVEPGLPRFFTIGDTFRFKVAAFNKTDAKGTATLDLKADNLLRLDVMETEAQIGPMDSEVFTVRGRALKSGSSKLVFSSRMGSLDDTVEMSIPVQTGYLRWFDNVFGTLSFGSTVVTYELPETVKSMPLDEIGADDMRFTLMVSGSPFLRMAPGLKYLLRYPYGCIEQTSSGVMPLAALRGLIKNKQIPGYTVEETDKYLDSGVKRLLGMQTASGGFGYWPGNITPDHWGSIYATVALTYSAKSGFDVPKDRMDAALKYLTEAVTAEGRYDDSFKGFAVYVLAMNGKLDRALFDGVYARIKDNSREAALMTLMAGRMSGYLNERDASSMAKSILSWTSSRDSSDNYYARYRSQAIALIAATEFFPKDPLAGNLAQSLMGGINKEGIWTSTSDTGWSLVALGGYFRSMSASKEAVKVSVRVADGETEEFRLKPEDTRTIEIDPKAFIANQKIGIRSLDGSIVYGLSMVYPRTDYAETGVSQGFEIQKKIENTDGTSDVRVGDIVKVTVFVKSEGHMRYVVLDDPLPAGLVAINSALKTEEHIPKEAGRRDENEDEGDEEDEDYGHWYFWDPETGHYRFIPNHFEIRDDRVLAFRDELWGYGSRYQYSYYARAVCEGEFTVPATKVQLMYEPERVAYTPVTKLKVLPRK